MDGGCAICGKHEYLIPLHGEKGGPKWAPPQVVTEATDAYFEDQDTTKQWLEDCTSDGGPYAFTPTAELYASWKAWCDGRGIAPGGANRPGRRRVPRPASGQASGFDLNQGVERGPEGYGYCPVV